MNKDTLKDLEERILNHSMINTSLESFKLMYDLLKYNLEALKELDEVGDLIITELNKLSDKIIVVIKERL